MIGVRNYRVMKWLSPFEYIKYIILDQSFKCASVDQVAEIYQEFRFAKARD